MLPNFSSEELRCQGSGGIRLAPGFGSSLQGLRDALTLSYASDGMHPAEAESAAAMIINSACRSRSHNEAVDGHPRSLHVYDEPHHPTKGCAAVDIRAKAGKDDDYRERLISLAWERGWSVGHHPSFIHLDMRTAYTDLPQAEFDY